MPNPFPISSARAWHATYEKFRKSRVKYWVPKVEKLLDRWVGVVLNSSGYFEAINKAQNNVVPVFDIFLDIYSDAGRIMGAKAYQLIKKQVNRLKESGVKMRRLPDYGDPATLHKSLLPIGVNEELINEIIAYLQLHNVRMVAEVTDTMREWIVSKLVEGQREAKLFTQIADEIAKSDFTKNRAIVIARTETVKAANYGAIQGAKKSGYKMNKQWVSAQDNRTRRTPRDAFSHLAMDGINIPIDEKFHVLSRNGGYEEMMQPGDPTASAADIINCRCTIGFVVQTGEDGLPVKV